MLGRIPVLIPFISHRLADGGLGGGYEGFWQLRIWVRSCQWGGKCWYRCVLLGGRFSSLIRRFVSGYPNMCWNPLDLNRAAVIAKIVKGLNGFDQNVLS